MTRVFTVYNCGTGFSRENADELVANLASRTEGSENREWMINSGPGSAPKGDPKKSLVKTPGTVDPVTGMKLNVRFAGLKGITKGFGWEQNVEHAMAVLRAINAGSNEKIGVVNMAGWSRGAITCHMLAHAMKEDPSTRETPVHIFAVDPVPGPGNFGALQTTLPSNVRRYTAVIQEDEARQIMKPVVIAPRTDEHLDVKYKMYVMPGAHNTGAMRLKTEVGLIVAYLAHRFLGKHGTKLRNPVQLTSRDLCELYGKIRLDLSKFRKMKGSGLQRKLLGTQARTSVPNAFRDTPYFINDHHRSHFEKAFPVVWQALGGGAIAPAALKTALDQVRSSAPTTWKSLQAVGIV